MHLWCFLWNRILLLVSALYGKLLSVKMVWRLCAYNCLTNANVRFKAHVTSFKCLFPVNFQMSVWREANLIDIEETFIFEEQTVMLKEKAIVFLICYQDCFYLELLPKAMRFINVKSFFLPLLLPVFFQLFGRTQRIWRISILVYLSVLGFLLRIAEIFFYHHILCYL